MAHSCYIQKARARRGRRKNHRPALRPMESYQFRNPDQPYHYKKYTKRYHPRQRRLGWAGKGRNSAAD